LFTDFFYILRKRKVPVSVTEWMTLMTALNSGFIGSLDDFYFLARAILVKSEAFYDHYDVAFQEYFNGIEPPAEISEQIREWLNSSLNRSVLSKDEQALLNGMNFDDLMAELEKRLKEQTEQHDVGDYWIGRGGTSPFGHSGFNAAGIRIGGESGGRRAVQIAGERRFLNYRHDLTLDVRQIKVALKALRQLTRTGPEDELDLDETVEATARNAGEIELMWQRNRKNTVKVLLLMDVGGSMNPFASMCSQLFSAAHASNHFKDFSYYYFHNCIYDYLYQDIERSDAISTDHLLLTLEPDYKLVLVGDARMATSELMHQYGAINYFERNEMPGMVWLKRIAEHFTHHIWLNPEELRFWAHPTVHAISRTFPMFPLTLDGLTQGIRRLMVNR